MLVALLTCGLALFPAMAVVRAEMTGPDNVTTGPSPTTSKDVIWKPSGDMGLQLGEPGFVVVFNTTGSESIVSGLNLSLFSVAWRPDGSYALLIGQCGTVLKFIDMRSGLLEIESHTNVDLKSISWKPDGSYALITGSDGVMLRFDHITQMCFQVETNTIFSLGSISWDNSGQQARIKSDDGNTISYPPPVEGPSPEIHILDPVTGASVSGTYIVSGTASVQGGLLSHVLWSLDFGEWEPAYGREIWQFYLDSCPLPNGRHAITVSAWSSTGDVASATSWFTVDNPILPPMINIVSPEEGAALSGMVVASGSAAGWYGPIERVDVRLDDSPWGPAVGTWDWKVTIDTNTMPNGVHRLKARAWDGNSFSVVSCTFTVANLPQQSSQSAPYNPPSRTSVPPATTPEDTDETPAASDQSIPGTPQDPVGPKAPAPIGKTADGGTVSVPMASWGILLLAALALATEHGKFAIFQFLFVPLYSRIKKDRVLDNFTRGMIYGFIMSNPGVHYNFIKQKLGLNNGSIVYHLTVLERQELIKSEKVGLYKRFYPRNGSLSESGIMELSDAQERMLELVKGNPGLTQRDIAERMGLSGRVVNYHVGLLQRSRLLTLEKVGKVTRCYATERMPVC